MSEQFVAGNPCGNTDDRIREFASLHPGGANFLMTDGSVCFVTETLDFRVYQALSTIQGGEVVSEGF